MKKLSQIKAWVEWQQSTGHAGIESFVYMLGLIGRLGNALNNAPRPAGSTPLNEYVNWQKETHKLLMELRQ
jgi:hypothetical protein